MVTQNGFITKIFISSGHLVAEGLKDREQGLIGGASGKCTKRGDGGFEDTDQCTRGSIGHPTTSICF